MNAPMGPAALVIGNLNVDIVLGAIGDWPLPGTEISLPLSDFRIGGSAGNSAVLLHRLGRRTHLLSAHGTDPMGDWLRRLLGPMAADCASLDASTSFSIGLLHSGGERTFFSNQGHLEKLGWRHIEPKLTTIDRAAAPLALLSGAFTTPKLRADYMALIAALDQRGTAIAIDPGWPAEGWSDAVKQETMSWFAACDYILINEIEALALSDRPTLADAVPVLRGMLQPDALLVVKRGREGASGFSAGRQYHCPAPLREVVDTVGAGDAFNAGFIDAIMAGVGVDASLARGVAVASNHVAQFPRPAFQA